MPNHAHAHALARAHTHKHRPKQHPSYVTLFVALHSSDARDIAALSGIPIEVVLAQSALESNWGRTVEGNAFFGVKGKSATGNSTTFATHEVTASGKRVSETDEFRAFASYAEAAADYASLIQRKFPAAFAYRDDPVKFANSVAKQHYATDPHYGEKLGSIIRAHITPILDK